MEPDTTKKERTIYWASWRRVIVVAVFFGAMVMIGFYLDGMSTLADFVRGLIIALGVILIFFVMLGTTFFRIKNNRLHYTSSLFEWHSMDISDIVAITLVPRFFFTNKVTAVQIEKRDPGLFPGMLLSRDAFPDETIAALVSHLRRINPSIMLDDGVQEILRSQERELK